MFEPQPDCKGRTRDHTNEHIETLVSAIESGTLISDGYICVIGPRDSE